LKAKIKQNYFEAKTKQNEMNRKSHQKPFTIATMAILVSGSAEQLGPVAVRRHVIGEGGEWAAVECRLQHGSLHLLNGAERQGEWHMG
jgi:hypothetical protein